MRSDMIELRGIEKSYDSGAGKTFVLRRINLTIKEGEFLTIMGPSGAGKSTLLSIRECSTAVGPASFISWANKCIE